MQASNVVSSASPAKDGGEPGPADLTMAPELWPVGIWDAVWIVACVAGAQLLLLVL
jgi:hypothetical protein